MHIAVLVTNTDESTFADNHPQDGEKFCLLLQEVRPDWTFDVYSVKDGIFPQDYDTFDGAIVTGSPASVHDSALWIVKLSGLLRALHKIKLPVFGACFGHQAIATALGGTVAKNPEGWVLGTVEVQMAGRVQPMLLYAAHKEQVTTLPLGAEVIARGPHCPIAGFALGAHIMTTQYHPEMTPEFIAALLDEMAAGEPADVIEPARRSLIAQADRSQIAGIMARFFEQAQKGRAGGG